MDLEYHFKLLWGKPFQGKMSKLSKCKYKFRLWFGRQPLDYRKTISDEEYTKMERANHYECKAKTEEK